MQDWNDAGLQRCRKGRMQEDWNAGTYECWKGGMQDSMDVVLYRRDAVQEVSRTGGIQDRWDAGQV